MIAETWCREQVCVAILIMSHLGEIHIMNLRKKKKMNTTLHRRIQGGAVSDMICLKYHAEILQVVQVCADLLSTDLQEKIDDLISRPSLSLNNPPVK